MSDGAALPEASHNLPEFTVGELALALRQAVESGFARVRVRGEISGFKRHASGHWYFSLKDEDAVIDACCWRPVAQRMRLAPEDGMEVVAIGRMTTYPGRSKYQIIVESLDLAGRGALLALVEERRQRLAAEGLFAPERKRHLPFLPRAIGVVTSPTGAVIRDILHRLEDRFPRPVLLWPVPVQGEGAAERIAAAIAGFNALPIEDPGGGPTRPDVLIVGRGGGSIEDLMAFNEEVVVRAVAASAIPVIAAVGHETDTTLVDFAADRRAPTPTAAAEICVPVRMELRQIVQDRGLRLDGAMAREVQRLGERVDGLARGLGDPHLVLGHAIQRLDDWDERLERAARGGLSERHARLAELAARLPHPRERIELGRTRLTAESRALDTAMAAWVRSKRQVIDTVRARVDDHERRLDQAWRQRLEQRTAQLDQLGHLLETLSHRSTLARGFAMVLDHAGQVVVAAADTAPGDALELRFADGAIAVTRDQPSAGARQKPRRAATAAPDKQGSLL